MPDIKDFIERARRGKGISIFRQALANRGSDREALADMDKGGGGGGRNYTYTVLIPEDEEGLEIVGILRGNKGKLHVSFDGQAFEGALRYVTDLRMTTEYGEFSGYVYNGRFEGEQLCHFFGDSPLEEDYYFWAVAEGSYSQNQPPPFDLEYSLICTRTSP